MDNEHLNEKPARIRHHSTSLNNLTYQSSTWSHKQRKPFLSESTSGKLYSVDSTCEEIQARRESYRRKYKSRSKNRPVKTNAFKSVAELLDL